MVVNIRYKCLRLKQTLIKSYLNKILLSNIFQSALEYVKDRSFNMDNMSSDNDKKIEKNKSGIYHMPKAVPAILVNIMLERFSTTATSGKYAMKCLVDF